MNLRPAIEDAIKTIEVKELDIQQLNNLTKNIHNDFHNGILENEIVVVDALTRIALELSERRGY